MTKTVRKGFAWHRCLIIVLFLLIILSSCSKTKPPEQEKIPAEDVVEKEEEVTYQIKALNEGKTIFYASEDHYRYGPSIIRNDDGTMDAWFSSPGNSGSQWDWITYRHYDGDEWSKEEIVLKPSSGSKDRCSVCDPGVICFGGYYYLAYTATDYYEGQGSYNMAFVARSKNPDGPFEKWNGTSWGGDPEPIIYYDGGQDNWGIGEVSFVIKDEDLFIYYSYIDIRDTYIGLCKADLTDDWPSTIRDKGAVLYQLDHDSVEVVYDENLDTFLAFTIQNRLLEDSYLIVYMSDNGKDFTEIASVKEDIEDYAHNMGVAKSKEGYIDSNGAIVIGYAYGKNWGKWDLKIQKMLLSRE
ncbi:MAG: hypothetical protein IJI46_05320 [Erysipelotrichaceae bacterium]|nr:hypothetical protein [Erysipelotrichaceae bacterium]